MGIQLQKLDHQIIISASEDALAETTASIIIKAFTHILAYKDSVNFIPSSGNTPRKTYQLLATKYRDAIEWSRVTIVQMDEYDSSELKPDMYFKAFLQKNLVDALGVGRFISMQKTGTKSLYTPEQYSQILKSLGTIDFALHGIGRNGHIGFNEPGSTESSNTRLITLAEDTRQDNFPSLENSMRPRKGMTLGLRELKAVSHTLLIATGAQKAGAIKALMQRAPIHQTPACALWGSPDFGVIVDRAAANLA